jgi:hypothetical protein
MDARRTLWSVAAILTLTAGVQALQMAPAGNIGGQWPLDSVSGTTTPDVSGNNNTATLVAAPTANAGLTGGGLQLNGSTQYLTVPNVATLDPAAGSFSVAIWVNPANTSNMRVYNKWNGTMGFVFDINAGAGGAAAPGAIRCRLNDGAIDNDRTLAAGMVASAWQHIAVTVDRTGNVLKFYRNGAQVGADQALTLASPLTNTALVGIGVIPAATGAFFNGSIDEPIFYKRVLTLAEVQSLATMPPAAPASLTPTNGVNQVSLAWPTVAGASTYNVSRSQLSGGPYTLIASGIAGLTYTDNTAQNPYTYYYVVQAVAGATPGPNSPQAIGTPLPPPVTAAPNTGLQTNENLTTTQFTVTYNAAVPAAGSRLTVVSNDTTEGAVSTTAAGAVVTPTGFYIDYASGAGTPSVVVTVTGVDDSIVDGPRPYTVSITATNMAVTIPDVSLTNNDNDIPGITFSRTSGVGTDESGGTATFTVSLNTQPFGFIDLPLSSSDTLEATVSPATLRFTPTGNPTYIAATGVGDWNVAHVVTVTGVDDTVLDFTIPFTVVTGALQLSNASDNPAYAIDPSDVTGFNLDNEAIPTLPTVWGGGGGGGGGCGLLGLELVLVLAAAGVARRRNS